MVIKEEEPIAEWAVKFARGFFVFTSLFASVFCWIAIRKLHGFQPRFDVGALWFFTIMIGATLWLAPSRGLMSRNLAVTQLYSIGFVLMMIGALLDHLTSGL